MTHNLKPYSTYKPSGVAWLGEIPASWDIRRLSFLFTRSNAGEVIDKGHWGEGDELLFTCAREPLSSDYSYFPMEKRTTGRDLLLTRNGTPYVHTPPANAIYSNVVQRITLKSGFDRGYLSYALGAACQGLKGYGVSIESLNFDMWKSLSVAFPTEQEQHRIATFLDHKTAEIDEAISKKQRLIDLLKEQKAILIDQAVTKGLNPNVPMRDSGVEWIGEVPAHWEVRRAKYIFREVDERSKTGAEELLSVSHMTGVTPRSEKIVYMFMAEDYAGSKLCRKGDLVINIMWAWMGALGVSDRAGIVSPSYGIFRQQEKEVFNTWYLEHLLRSVEYVAEYNRRSTGLRSSRLRLYADMFLAMKLSIPSKEEQDHIESITTKRTNEIDKTVDAVEREINALNELKSIMISQAVTGKIKV